MGMVGFGVWCGFYLTGLGLGYWKSLLFLSIHSSLLFSFVPFHFSSVLRIQNELVV